MPKKCLYNFGKFVGSGKPMIMATTALAFIKYSNLQKVFVHATSKAKIKSFVE